MIKQFIRFLGVTDKEESTPSSQPPTQEAATDSVRQIIARLDQLAPEQSHYIALFSSILSRVAHSDLNMSEVERMAIEEVVMKIGHLDQATAVLVTEIAKYQNELLGGVENYLITRAFKGLATEAQKFELMESLFAVAAAEAGISAEENQEVLKIAEEIGLTRQDFLAVRSRFKEHLNLLKDLP